MDYSFKWCWLKIILAREVKVQKRKKTFFWSNIDQEMLLAFLASCWYDSNSVWKLPKMSHLNFGAKNDQHYTCPFLAWKSIRHFFSDFQILWPDNRLKIVAALSTCRCFLLEKAKVVLISPLSAPLALAAESEGQTDRRQCISLHLPRPTVPNITIISVVAAVLVEAPHLPSVSNFWQPGKAPILNLQVLQEATRKEAVDSVF